MLHFNEFKLCLVHLAQVPPLKTSDSGDVITKVNGAVGFRGGTEEAALVVTSPVVVVMPKSLHQPKVERKAVNWCKICLCLTKFHFSDLPMSCRCTTLWASMRSTRTTS